MEPKSSLNHSVLLDLNGHYHCSYGGVIIPDEQHYNNTGRKKSKVRLNDQLIPKPTDINIAEKMIKTAAPKEHPYSSHISRSAMFPSFCSPNDPETGAIAALQPYLSPLIQKSTPDVKILSKTFGGPYRHEILVTPIKNRKTAVMWTGENSFLDQAKQMKGAKKVFYPNPPKTVLANPKLGDLDISLSKRTCDILKSLERTHWITSYQMHYTGSGLANPLKIDDFKEKMSALTGMNSYTASLRERSDPVFVSSNPKQGCRGIMGRSTCSPTTAKVLNPSSAAKQGTATATINQHRPQEIIARHNEATHLNPKGLSWSENGTSSTERLSTELSQEVSHQKQTECKSSVYKEREGENKVHFDESLRQVFMSQSSQDANCEVNMYNRPLSQGERDVNREKSPICLCDRPRSKKQYFNVGRNPSSHSQWAAAKDQAGIYSPELLSRAAPVKKELTEVRGLSHSISNRISNPYMPGNRPVDRVRTMDGENAALSLLDLQNSFIKSEAHRNFNSSLTHAAGNLRGSVVTAKKHNFYGISCYYLHG